MAAFGNIVLADALATPVNHTFAPKRLFAATDGAVITEWEDRSPAAMVGWKRIELTIHYPTPKRRSVKVRLRVLDPVLDVMTNSASSGIAPAPSLAYVCVADLMFILPERSTAQARKDLRKYVQFLLADSQIVDVLENISAPV